MFHRLPRVEFTSGGVVHRRRFERNIVARVRGKFYCEVPRSRSSKEDKVRVGEGDIGDEIGDGGAE